MAESEPFLALVIISSRAGILGAVLYIDLPTQGVDDIGIVLVNVGRNQKAPDGIAAAAPIDTVHEFVSLVHEGLVELLLAFDGLLGVQVVQLEQYLLGDQGALRRPHPGKRNAGHAREHPQTNQIGGLARCGPVAYLPRSKGVRWVRRDRRTRGAGSHPCHIWPACSSKGREDTAANCGGWDFLGSWCRPPSGPPTKPLRDPNGSTARGQPRPRGCWSGCAGPGSLPGRGGGGGAL